jgi:hypothetical protein
MSFVLTWPVGRDKDSGPDPPPFAPVGAYALASALGGGSMGFVIAQVAAVVRDESGLTHTALGAAAAVTATAAVVLQWTGRLRPLPERRAQVPRRWVRWRRRTVMAAAFGLIIGSGALTYLKHASAYALAALIVLAPSIFAGALVGALYGLSRGMTLVADWIGDRFVGRRPTWPGLGQGTSALNRALATAALLALAAVLVLVY